jgi:FkbM family methyltransferase
MRRTLRGLILAVTRFLLRGALVLSTPGIFAEALQLSIRRDPRYATKGLDAVQAALQKIALEMELPLGHRQVCYSQEGEDLILSRIFAGRNSGFYVDVGAHHPARFSNTYLLYCRGWRGINIDAMPGAMRQFQRQRPGDINVEAMVSSNTGPCTFFLFDELALNTASQEVLQMRRTESPQYRVTRGITVTPRPLAAILADNLPVGTDIDLMNIDVEGLDLEVLSSNDWERFSPEVIVVEILSTDLATIQETELYKFLAAQGYRMTSKLFNSAIFQRQN